MYIKSLKVSNFRNFKKEKISFPDLNDDQSLHNNVHLLLGPNGSGKTTLLKAIAIGAIGEILPKSGFIPDYLVRETKNAPVELATIDATFTLHPTDGGHGELKKQIKIHKNRGILQPKGDQSSSEVLFNEASPGFLIMAYSASRWVPVANQADIPTARNRQRGIRYQRIASLFEDNFGLMPFEAWVPTNAFKQVPQFAAITDLVNQLLPPEIKIKEPIESVIDKNTDVLFEYEGINLPLRALSDSYRSYLGWIGDLVFHLVSSCPANMNLNEIPGIVLIDEIDLHLHPTWQRHVLNTISKALPKLQFIVTSHSPLIAGTLKAQNIHLIGKNEEGEPNIKSFDQEIRGLDADQILLSSYFNLRSTRAVGFQDDFKELYEKAMTGDIDARLALMDYYTKGTA